MNIKRKIAIAAVPAVMALASTSVDSKILLMSQEGWEVSFDGAANAFVMKNSVSDVPTDTREVLKSSCWWLQNLWWSCWW